MRNSLTRQQLPDKNKEHALHNLCQHLPDKMKTLRDIHAESFADYMIDAQIRTGLSNSDIAKKSGVTRQTIGQLINKTPHNLTGKLLLPKRETVDKIADAFEDDRSIARAAAGYSSEEPHTETNISEQAALQRTKADPLEDALLTSLSRKIEADGLSEEGERRIKDMLDPKSQKSGATKLKSAPTKYDSGARRITRSELNEALSIAHSRRGKTMSEHDREIITQDLVKNGDYEIVEDDPSDSESEG